LRRSESRHQINQALIQAGTKASRPPTPPLPWRESGVRGEVHLIRENKELLSLQSSRRVLAQNILN
jgi:hypothetical protein